MSIYLNLLIIYSLKPSAGEASTEAAAARSTAAETTAAEAAAWSTTTRSATHSWELGIRLFLNVKEQFYSGNLLRLIHEEA